MSQSTDAPTHSTGTRAVLAEPRVRVLLVGLAVSKLGAWMSQVALGWLALELTGSPFVLGLMTVASALPVLILALPAGLIADRFDRARIVAVTSFASLVAYVVMAGLAATDRMTVASLLVTATIAGCATALELPALQSLMGQVAGPGRMATVISLYALVFNVTRVVGPAMGGAALAAWGAGVVFGLNALSFAPLILGLVLTPMHAMPDRRISGAYRALAEAAEFVRLDRRILVILILLAVDVSFGASFISFAPAIAAGIGAGPEGVGLILSAAGIGAVVAGVALTRLPESVLRHHILLVAGLLMVIGQLGVALAPEFGMRVILAGVAGGGLIAYNATTTVLIHTLTPNALRGRVMSFFAIAIGAAPVGGLTVGAIADATSISFALVIASGIWATTLLAMTLRVPSLRSL